MKHNMPNEHEIVGFEISVSARDDGTLEAAYIRFREGKVAESRELEEDVMVADYDAEGRLLGVEILSPVRIPQLENLVGKSLTDKGRRAGFKKFLQSSLPHPLVECEC